jgi:D-alanyl-D-alanine carboxypeptidase/D-alanyl-D-alanine-endopeptidase (penicillin-binding protein 4)
VLHHSLGSHAQAPRDFSYGPSGAAFLIAFWLAASACHASAKPALPRGPAGRATEILRTSISTILAQPALERGYWGVLVKSLQTDETLFALNPHRLLMPASNMKILTLAASAERLGWDYTYETKLLAAGTIDHGRLRGDLVVVGSGDPSLMVSQGMAAGVFQRWAERLTALGIRSVAGGIIGDDRAFERPGLGFGWSWDDLADGYAAPIGALQLNENAVRVTITPGAAAGEAATVVVDPRGSGLNLAGSIDTDPANAAASITLRRLPGSTRVELSGSIPQGSHPVVRTVSVDRPAFFFVNTLRETLIAQGIEVAGPAVCIDVAPDPHLLDAAVDVAVYRSPPLSELAVRLMKISQNQYAETLLETMGGLKVIEAVFQKWGMQSGSLVQRDGSGLSRYDYVTPATIVLVLEHVDQDARLREPFEASLPIAGRDGGLANRMSGTRAEGNARAKTGSMSNVRALSGYVTTADGEPLAFAIIANNFETSPETITRAEDAIVIRLAEFSRR